MKWLLRNGRTTWQSPQGATGGFALPIGYPRASAVRSAATSPRQPVARMWAFGPEPGRRWSLGSPGNSAAEQLKPVVRNLSELVGTQYRPPFAASCHTDKHRASPNLSAGPVA